MEELIGIAGLLTLGAITPGPNNVLVMREGARAGFLRALPTLFAIIAGVLLLLTLVAAGAAPLLAARPWLARAVTLAGSLFLGLLGGRLVIDSSRARDRDPANHSATDDAPRSASAGIWGPFVFQFLNPKAWILVATLVSAARSSSNLAVFPHLTILFGVITAVCLSLWACLGSMLMRALDHGRRRAWFDRTSGGLLIAFAAILSWSTIA